MSLIHRFSWDNVLRYPGQPLTPAAGLKVLESSRKVREKSSVRCLAFTLHGGVFSKVQDLRLLTSGV